MVKFEIKTGCKAKNMKAKQRAQLLKPYIKGMYCSRCHGVDTVIRFVDATSYGLLPTTVVTYLQPEVEACCPDFKNRVEAKITGE